MKEEFLYYVWQYQLFSSVKLFTVNNVEVIVKKVGERNFNSGPDFLNAQLVIDQQLWVGNVEIHVTSSDWYAHNHENDSNYDAVILHVVWEHDATVFMKNNQPLPTLVLKDFVAKEVFENYQKLHLHKTQFIPCENQIGSVNDFIVINWLERLYFERLEQKSTVIHKLLQETNSDYEAVLFYLLAKNFGLKINGDAFFKLATSMDFSIVRKVSDNESTLMALLFGQAGFLEEEKALNYYKKLQSEYNYVKHKYQLKPISKNHFQFFRMRPQNFPTIRIAQLGALYVKHQQLFSKILSISKKDDFYKLFSVSVNDFWKTHYTFDSTSKKSAKKLSKSFIDLILINTIIPLQFVYLQNRGEAFEESILHLIQQISAEKNSIISNFSSLKIDAKNAQESQALLELKNNYCTKKRCLQCAIGNALLKK